MIRRMFTATLILGVSGAGKTSLLETFATYLWETHQSILLLYSWDGGAIPTNLQKRMKQGLIRFWRVRTRSAPGLALDSLYFGTKGYWPKRIDPLTGETSPGEQLIAPVTTRYAVTCAKGHPLLSVPLVSLIVPTVCTGCRNSLIDRAQMIVHETVARTKGFEQVGGVAYDGLTSMTNVVMDHMDSARGAGQIGGEKYSFGGVVTSGAVTFGGNNRADVGFAQTRAQQFVNNSLGIPSLKEGPVFTALSTEGTDKGGLSIIGADLPGQAALTQVPQWFGNICEADQTIDDSGKLHFALRIRPYTDKQGRRHLLKTSASPVGPVPDMLIDPPVEEKRPFESFNLGRMFQLLDQDLALALGTDNAEPLVPLLADYGEAVRVETPTTPPTPSATTPAAQTPIPSVTPPVVTAGSAGPSIPQATKRPRSKPSAVGTSPAPVVAAPVSSGGETPAATSSSTPPPGMPPPPPGARPPMRAPGT